MRLETHDSDSGASISKGDAAALTASLITLLKRPPAISPRQFVTRTTDVRTMVQAYEALSGEGV